MPPTTTYSSLPRPLVLPSIEAATLSGLVTSTQASVHVVQLQPDPYQLRQRQAARLRRLMIATLFAGFYLTALVAYYLCGLIDLKSLYVAMMLVTGVVLLFHGIFATGFNRKARDRDLKTPITVSSLAIMLSVALMAPATLTIFTPFAFVCIAFGMYRISQKTMLLLTGGALTGFAVVAATHYARWQDAAMLRSALLQLMVLAFTLPGFAMLAGRVRHLHHALFKAGRKIRDIEHDAQRDALIGCYNRRYIIAALEQQKRIADQHGTPLCLAVLDLDHFKRINDEAGHLGGDDVLRGFSKVAQKNLRKTDVFGRYGGEEFLLVLPATALLVALNAAERIRDQVENHSWQTVLPRHVTVSIGLTQYIPGESVLDLFARADTAMYLAKQGGRNQVVVEEPILE